MNPKTLMIIEIEKELELPRTNTLYNIRSDELSMLVKAIKILRISKEYNKCSKCGEITPHQKGPNK